MCKPVLTREKALKIKMPNCYVMIENFQIPEEREYKSIQNNEEALSKLNIDDGDIGSKMSSKKLEQEEEDEEEFEKEKELKKNLPYNLREKILI